ncbi:hypothetical protein ABH944_003433 [Caballeronia udeis]|uniref:Short-chain dehydrogenase/reductase SDR n=1 Tax=Caballeronia udeis TaxID=1232866 RepID=A0ABW8MKI9_9BURK
MSAQVSGQTGRRVVISGQITGAMLYVDGGLTLG